MDKQEPLRRLKEKVKRDIGPALLPYLESNKTVEFMVNPDGTVWVESLGSGMKHIGEINSFSTQSIIESVAAYHHLEATPTTPIVEGTFPLDESRFAGMIPPATSRPTFSIRKKASSIFTLEDYVKSGSMTSEQKEKLSKAVKTRKNIIIAGSTGSGKTTLVNAVIHEIERATPTHRVITLEDTAEIQTSAKNCVNMFACRSTSLSDLVRVT